MRLKYKVLFGKTSRGTHFLPQGQRVAETGYKRHKTMDFSCINKQHVTDNRDNIRVRVLVGRWPRD